MEVEGTLLKADEKVIGTADGNTFAYYRLSIEDTTKMLTIM